MLDVPDITPVKPTPIFSPIVDLLFVSSYYFYFYSYDFMLMLFTLTGSTYTTATTGNERAAIYPSALSIFFLFVEFPYTQIASLYKTRRISQRRKKKKNETPM